MKNNIRFDLSDYLIHFFRDVDLETGSIFIYLNTVVLIISTMHVPLMLNIYLDYLYAVIKFSRPGHTEMDNEPYMVTPRWYALQICRLQLI